MGVSVAVAVEAFAATDAQGQEEPKDEANPIAMFEAAERTNDQSPDLSPKRKSDFYRMLNVCFVPVCISYQRNLRSVVSVGVSTECARLECEGPHGMHKYGSQQF